MVLSMHGRTSAQYGRVGCQDDRQFGSWCDFYRAVYDVILFEAQKVSLLPKKVYKRIARIHDRLDRILAHTDEPRLTHGDLWSTNVLAGVDGDGRWQVRALIDPNCKFAHAESELAYLELFETVTPAFMKAYQSDRKLDPDYHRVRKPIYQLYPLIDHLQMFGAEYADAVKQSVERIEV
jgi:fructosamine-3-kinase